MEIIFRHLSGELPQVLLPLPDPYAVKHPTSWRTGTSHHLRTSGNGTCFSVTSAGPGRLLDSVRLEKTDWPAWGSEDRPSCPTGRTMLANPETSSPCSASGARRRPRTVIGAAPGSAR
ncbi:hypothetical protein AB0O31_14770 [Kitasatospora cineracea]|uniref:hypothetical protein n=1 Tax=Kitasatospora cineracea TaxID=88074 RepID=UPI003427F1FE